MSLTTDNGSNFVRLGKLCTESEDPFESDRSSDTDSETSQSSVAVVTSEGAFDSKVLRF